MWSQSDKAWVGGLIAWAGQFLATRYGLSWITPELLALITGAAVYWVPNKAPATTEQRP